MMLKVLIARRSSYSSALLLVALVLGAGGCSTLGGEHASSTDAPSFASGQESARDQLNDGYSDLYSNSKSLSQVDRIFYVKFESDDVQRVAEDVTGYSGQLAERMQSLTHDFPALKLDRETLPPILRAALETQKKATLKRFAPVVGASGAVFERGLLIRLLGAVDQQHYIAATVADREPDPALSKIMAAAAKRYADLYDEIDTLLDERFYR